MKTTVFRYNVIIRKEGKNYIADAPTLGISDFGTTIEQAKKHVLQAIRIHIEGLVKTGTEVPPPDTDEFFIAPLEVTVPFAVRLT